MEQQACEDHRDGQPAHPQSMQDGNADPGERGVDVRRPLQCSRQTEDGAGERRGPDPSTAAGEHRQQSCEGQQVENHAAPGAAPHSRAIRAR
ncbi:hypothetical protein [Acidihalobacter aeolianus]|uniref:hypothetical protein n=1 Tax=Acidihalobacter aeolianus TaxID=2792603 RepID=UPI001E52F864|nr:hypothetical protein [Acidihalobacter aeolianus]